MMKSKVRRKIIAAVIVLVVIGVISGIYFSSHEPWQVKIATATRGGTYFPLGDGLARILGELGGKHIEKAEVLVTRGSKDNIDLIISQTDDKADIAFVQKPVLIEAIPEVREKVRILAKLYKDVIHVVVRKSSNIKSLRDLKGKTIYIGKEGSGTKIIAKNILDTFGIIPNKNPATEVSYSEAAEMLMSKQLDAAIFTAGIPAEAVKKALESDDCRLLDIEDSLEKIKAKYSYLDEDEIPGQSYMNQPKSLRTLSTEVLLVGRKDLDDDLVFLIEDALFDNLKKLFNAHTRAEDMRINTAFDTIPKGYELHPGVIKFREEEKHKLHIATGTLTGKYYDLGKKIQDLLGKRGIRTRALHTGGSVENAGMLFDEPARTIAIMQYDVALASYFGNLKKVYKKVEDINIQEVKNMRLIAPLHNEKVHIIIKRDKLPAGVGTDATVNALKDLRICLGPENSGTRLIAESILRHHGIFPKSPIFLTVPNMVEKLNSGDIDGGFMVCIEPSMSLEGTLGDDRNRLLSVVPHKLAQIWGSVFEPIEIKLKEYPCQRVDEPAVQTIQTQAILVTTEKLEEEFDVKTITEAIYEGAGYLNIEGGESMANVLSITSHSDANEFYLQRGYRGGLQRNFEKYSLYLTVIVFVLSGFKWLNMLRRNRITKLETKNIREISVDADEQGSVGKLQKIHAHIHRRSEKKWWNLEELDNSRIHGLENLINSQINEARLNLTNALLAEIRASGRDSDMDKTKRLEWYNLLEERIWIYLESGELDESKHDFLQKVIDRRRQEISERTIGNQTE
ncbi:TAXI family TRAP transporter solute-binding subunit [candidate division KSB1 bacterium]